MSWCGGRELTDEAAAVQLDVWRRAEGASGCAHVAAHVLYVCRRTAALVSLWRRGRGPAQVHIRCA